MNWLPPPGPARQRQVLLLVGLLVVLAILAWVEFGPARTSPTASNPQALPAAGAAPLVVPAPVKLDALTAVPAPEAVGRNPFGYGRTLPGAPGSSGRPLPSINVLIPGMLPQHLRRLTLDSHED